jgi:hypothetical protein
MVSPIGPATLVNFTLLSPLHFRYGFTTIIVKFEVVHWLRLKLDEAQAGRENPRPFGSHKAR